MGTSPVLVVIVFQKTEKANLQRIGKMHTTEWLSPKDIEYWKNLSVHVIGAAIGPSIMAEMLIETYKLLANTKCPVPKCSHGKIYHGIGRQVKYGDPAEEPCPNCGEFPILRRGYFAENWQGAAET